MPPAERLTGMYVGRVGVQGARRWWPALVAAVLVAAVVAVSVGISQYGGPAHQASPRSAPTATPTATPTEPAGAGSDAGDQLRQVSWRGVAVDVPIGWVDATAPDSAWCAYDQGSGEPPFPTQPYVARDTTFMGIAAIGCLEDSDAPTVFGDVPPRYWAPHVWFGLAEQSGGADQTSTYREWTLSSRTVGGVRVSVLADASTSRAAERILASAHETATGADGCDATSPAQAVRFVRPDPASDVTTLRTVDSVSICQYDRSGGTTTPGLLGSRTLVGSEAARVVAAIQQAPAGGGPDAPEHCLDTLYGDTALVVRLHVGSATHDLYVYYDWCFGNGFDDGTTRRELTRDACLPLWGGRVQLWSGSTEPFSRCHD